ncbi:MAG: hypothetical protein QXH21_08905 [Ignisphaera sp.]
MSELMEFIAELEDELEKLLREKSAKEINFVDIYHDPHTEWDYKVLWKIFDLLIQSLYPNNNIERIPLATDTPQDKYHIVLRNVINKLKNCRRIIVIREYDTLYYCIE